MGRLDIMPFEDSKDTDDEGINPLQEESRLRILDILERRPVGNEIQCISEPSLYLLRARVNDKEDLSVGGTIELPAENVGSLSEVRLKDLSGTSQQELAGALSNSIISDTDRHILFYNSAGPMSLKFHSFQLLSGIGNSKAIQMVQKRGIAGWQKFEDIDDDCGIESVKLLAERYVREMEDVAQTPRLLDLLVRKEK